MLVESKGSGRFVVADPEGSGRPHNVTLDAQGAVCDCESFKYRKAGTCKHVDAVLRRQEQSAGRAESRETAARKPRFRLYTCDELDQLPPTTWLIERHIPTGGFTVLYGAPGSGKSFLAIAWALSVGLGGAGAATGTWLRWQTRWGPVVYVAAEGGTGVRQRVRAYRDANELVEEPAVWVVREPVNLLEPGDVDALLADVGDAFPGQPALFVFDTLARCLGGGDENGPEAMGAAVLAADVIRKTTGAAVLFVHHTGRDGEMPRGHSSLDAAVDSMFFLKEEDGVRILECKKQRDAEQVEVQRLKLVPIGMSCAVEPAEGDATPKTLRPNDWKALRTLQTHFVGLESAAGVWQRVSGLSESSFYVSSKRLQEMGYVAKRGAKYVVTVAGESALKGTPDQLQEHSSGAD